MCTKHVGFGIVTLALLAGTTVWAVSRHYQPTAAVVPAASAAVVEGDDGDEVVISLADLPSAVRTALSGITTDAAVTQVAIEQGNGVTTFDVEYTKDGQTWAAEFSDAGTVLENEVDDEEADND
jgi:hypothetical protein